MPSRNTRNAAWAQAKRGHPEAIEIGIFVSSRSSVLRCVASIPRNYARTLSASLSARATPTTQGAPGKCGLAYRLKASCLTPSQSPRFVLLGPGSLHLVRRCSLSLHCRVTTEDSAHRRVLGNLLNILKSNVLKQGCTTGKVWEPEASGVVAWVLWRTTFDAKGVKLRHRLVALVVRSLAYCPVG